MRLALCAICLFLFSFAFVSSSFASSQADRLFQTEFEDSPLVEGFDWLSVWGSVDTTGQEDFIVPSSQLPVKADFKSLMKSCISDQGKINQSQMKASLVDFDEDGINDILVDGRSYFRKYASDSSACGRRLCSPEEGCAISLYSVGEARQLFPHGGGAEGRHDGLFATHGAFQNCPENPEDNTLCNAECPATEDLCPALFSYDMRRVWEGQIKKGTFVSVDEFARMAQQGQAMGQALYAARNSNPVLVLELGGQNMARCGADELAEHDGRCVKYYQYVGGQADGAFVDLHVVADNQNFASSHQDAFSARMETGGFASSLAMP